MNFRILLLIGCLALTQEGKALTPLVPTANNPYKTTQSQAYGRVVRTVLTPEETQTPLLIGLELSLHSSDELQSRIDNGEVLTRAELEKYLPTQADYNTAKAWLQSQGFTTTMESNLRHAIFVHGTIKQAATAFNTAFGRVATTDGEFTSALTEPQVPTYLTNIVRSVHGLQQHLIRHSNLVLHPTPLAPSLTQPSTVPQGFLDPSTLANYYNAPSALTGAGQTIAIVGDCIPVSSDLTQFWTECGLSQSVNNLTVIPIEGGPGADMTHQNELTLDVTWAGGIAPGAAIRLYAVPEPLNDITENAAYTQILNDLPNYPNIHVTTESYAGPYESSWSGFQLLAAQGVSVFNSSGDSGSNPNWTTDLYDSTAPLGVTFPASDPNVTGVGGTDLNLNSITALPANPESAWSIQGSPSYGTGGGTCTLTLRPSWQVGTGVPAGTTRCVPDVAAMSSFSMGNILCPFTIINGKLVGLGGTSLASPIWAGIGALLNQAQANSGFKPIGLLNAKIYSLIGTNAFTDITSGTNGAYNAGVGYDMCTGVGSPNIANLIAALQAGPPGALGIGVDPDIDRHSKKRLHTYCPHRSRHRSVPHIPVVREWQCHHGGHKFNIHPKPDSCQPRCLCRYGHQQRWNHLCRSGNPRRIDERMAGKPLRPR